MINQSLTKMLIKILILLLSITILFLIAAFLYSVRFWPDVYNYVNANITIKRIPTISELNVTEYDVDVTTEDVFTSTYIYEYTLPTIELLFEDDSEFNDFDFLKRSERASIDKNYNEVEEHGVVNDFSFYITEMATDNNLIVENEISEIETKDVEIFTEISDKRRRIQNQVQHRCYFNGTHNDITKTVFPWIAAIFVKNSTNDHFDYYCDGVLLSERIILTAARCVNQNNAPVDAENIIVLLGKRSLLYMGDDEKVVKVKKIEVHENFTNVNEQAENDLAILEIEEPISFNDAIQPACILEDGKSEDFLEDNKEIATTGWAFSGELSALPFDKEKSKDCNNNVRSKNIFCANYNNENTVCPSHGGVFVTKARDDIWYLKGVRAGDSIQNSFCINTGVYYTDLLQYLDWIQIHM